MTTVKKHLNRETVSYLICGIITTIFSIIVFWLCYAIGLHTAASNTISTVLAVLLAYVLNKIFVFRSLSWQIKTLVKEIGSFAAGRLVTYVSETLLLVLLVEVLGLPGFICKVFTTGLVVVANYMISKKWVFNRA